MHGTLTWKMLLLMFRGNVCFNMVWLHVCQERGYGHIPPHMPILQELRDHCSTCPPPASLKPVSRPSSPQGLGKFQGGSPQQRGEAVTAGTSYSWYWLIHLKNAQKDNRVLLNRCTTRGDYSARNGLNPSSIILWFIQFSIWSWISGGCVCFSKVLTGNGNNKKNTPKFQN